MKITESKLTEIVNEIDASWQGVPLRVCTGDHEGRLWVQVGTYRQDCDDPAMWLIGKGGKAYVSDFATHDEVVKKVFGLCMAYVEHEMREGFYYQGKRVFGPHITIEALMSVADKIKGRD